MARFLDRVPDKGDVVMLENVRYEKGETKNDVELARRYASLAEAYVNDAFGAAHRAHSSTEAVAHLLPSAAGRLLEREVATLRGILEDPQRPLVAVVGGRQGDRQDRRAGGVPRARRRGPGRWRDVLPVLRRPGPLGRRVAVRGGGDRARAEGARPREAAAPRGPRARPRVQRRHRGAGARRRRRAGRLDGARRRPAHRRRVRGHGAGGRDGVLERPDGGVRARAVRGRDARGGRRGRGVRGHDGGRRRRLGRGARAVRARRRGHAPLHRRRGLARARRGQGAARASRRCREPHPVHRRQLEAVQDRRGGGGLHPGAAPARRRGRRRRGRHLPAVHRAAGDGRLGARLERAGLRAEHARGRRGRVHRRDLGADAGRDRRRGHDPRALRAPAALQRDRQGAGAEGRRARSTPV